MRLRKLLALGWSGFATVLCAVLLPQWAGALANSPAVQQAAASPRQAYSPLLALAPGFAPAIDNLWFAGPPSPLYRSLTAGPFSDDPASPSFDIGGYDAMWNETWFSEMAAYGGLERDALRIAGMRVMNESGAVPYGRLTLQREFEQGQQSLGLGAYGLTATVQPTAISGFGSDSYTDMAVDATWRWTAHPEQSSPGGLSLHALVLHEGENLLASHAIFGTNNTDDLTVFRGDASVSLGNIAPRLQYFRITGSDDPVRLGTLNGSPNSEGCIAEVSYTPSDNPHSPLAWFAVRLSLQFVAYSEFDGSSHNAAHNNAVLFHLSAGGDSN